MTSYQFGLIILVMTFSFFSCQEDIVDPAPNVITEEPVILEIQESQQSYIAETGKHFYTDIFSEKNDTNLYRIKVKAGVKYHLICSQYKIVNTSIKLELSNSKGEIIGASDTYLGRPTGIKPEVIFTATDDDDLYLTVSLWGNNNETLQYNLYFQECAATSFNFNGTTWESVGNWKVTNSETLEYTGSDSHEFHWIRLITNDNGSVEMSAIMKSSTKTRLPSFGFISNGSTEMINWGEYAEELPRSGTFYNIFDTDQFRKMNLSGDGIYYNYGAFHFPDLNINDGVRIQLISNKIMINDQIQDYFSSGKVFYLVIEDTGFDKITFENFQITVN